MINEGKTLNQFEYFFNASEILFWAALIASCNDVAFVLMILILVCWSLSVLDVSVLNLL